MQLLPGTTVPTRVRVDGVPVPVRTRAQLTSTVGRRGAFLFSQRAFYSLFVYFSVERNVPVRDHCPNPNR